jgi:hypothetical protein
MPDNEIIAFLEEDGELTNTKLFHAMKFVLKNREKDIEIAVNKALNAYQDKNCKEHQKNISEVNAYMQMVKTNTEVILQNQDRFRGVLIRHRKHILKNATALGKMKTQAKTAWFVIGAAWVVVTTLVAGAAWIHDKISALIKP